MAATQLKHLEDKMKFIIRSVKRTAPNNWFCAIYGFSAQFFDIDKARRFGSRIDATEYARAELFTDDAAFDVVEVSE
jgi:hypothetical protein